MANELSAVDLDALGVYLEEALDIAAATNDGGVVLRARYAAALIQVIQRLRATEKVAFQWQTAAQDVQRTAGARIAKLERSGQELWALCMKYGLKHRPLCVMTAKPDGNECSCGLAEETHAVMDRVRLIDKPTAVKAGRPPS